MNKVILPILAALLIAAAAAPSCGKKQAGTEKDPGDGGNSASLKPRNDIKGLPNFAIVSDALYRGAQPTAEGFAELKKMGVKTIVDLRVAASDLDLLEGLGLNYVHISFKPWHPEEEDVIAFLKIVTDPGNQPVFVHCKHGADRTGTMVAVYRVTVQKWDLEKALSELPNFGFHKMWNNLKDYMREEFHVEKIMEKVRNAKMPKIEVVE